MPYVGEDVQPPRKRRWDDDKDDLYRVYGPEKQGDVYLVNQRSDFAPRKILPLSKRARIITDDGVHIFDDLPPTHRRRLSLQKPSQDHHENLEPRSLPRVSGASLLPCHICHRRPTKKSDLDSFADCQGCGERTCFVCIRQCSGSGAGQTSPPLDEDVLSRSFHMDDVDDLLLDQQPRNYNTSHTPDAPRIEEEGGGGIGDGVRPPNNLEREANHSRGGWSLGGHRTMVCSRCCVEKGAEGEVVCLGCLSRMEGA